MNVRRERKRVSLNRESGTYFVLTSILALVFIGLSGLIFGSAILASSRVRLKNLANITALTALNGYLSEEDADPTKKVETALNRVATILSKNSIPNARQGKLDSVTAYPDTSGSSGYVRFGLWYPIQPTCINCGDPCDGKYPCFKDKGDDGAVNSVKAFLRTGSDNPIIAPTQIFGGTEHLIQESSTASLVPRCVEFVLDISKSTVEQTHGFNLDPAGFPAFRVASRNGSQWTDNQSDQTTVETFQNCATKKNVGDQLAWCSVSGDPTPIKLNRADDPSPGLNDHFQDDYWFFRTPINSGSGPNRFLVDAYSFAHTNPPEPLTTFLRAFNAGSQEVAEQASSGDSLGVMAFSNTVSSDTGMSSAVDLIRQLTNIRNAFPLGAGANPNNVAWDPQGVVHPNFIDWNWIPVQGSTASNLIGALKQAYNRLIDPGTCPTFAKKIIILATDGLVNCVDTAKLPEANCATSGDSTKWSCDGGTEDDDPGTPDNPCFPCSGVNGFNTPQFFCQMSFTSYAIAESQIMEQDDVPTRTITSSGGSVSASAGTPEPGILKRLSDAGIAVTVLMSGAQTGPNFLNVGGADGKFINPEDAGPLGWDGLPYGTGTFSPFVKWTSLSSLSSTIAQANDINGADAIAFDSASSTNPFFRPNGLLAELAFRTGGIFCPLLPPGDSSRYLSPDASGVEYMKEGERASDSASFGMQQSSITNRTITEQARDCVSKALGANPYALQEEWSPPSS